jgi:hypothetical protein
MAVAGAQTEVTRVVLIWDGMSQVPHRFGGVEYRFGNREIGHIHGDYLVDIPFPTKVRDKIVAAGEAQPHHILPDSGWVSIYLREPADVERALDLLSRSYNLAAHQKMRRQDRDQSSS